jgi:hypothetical protein
VTVNTQKDAVREKNKIKFTLSDPARSTKWNLEMTVTHSPASSSKLSRVSWPRMPKALAGLRPPRPMADANEGVPGRFGVGDAVVPANTDPGRASLEGDRPEEDMSGEEERGGGPEPTNFF